MFRPCIVLFLTLMITTPSLCQTITSTSAGGGWFQPSTWIGGVVPQSGNSSRIVIAGPVYINKEDFHDGEILTISQSLTVNDSLQINISFEAIGISVSSTGSVLIGPIRFSVNGNVSVASGGVWQAAGDGIFSGDLSVSGSLFENGVTTFSDSTVLTGNGQKIFHNLNITGSFVPNAVYTLTGNLSVTGRGMLFPGANTTIMDGSDVKLNNTATARVLFNNLIILPGSSFTANAPFQVNNDFTVAGAFTGSAGFTVRGDMSVSVDTGIVIIQHSPFHIKGKLTVSSGAIFTVMPDADASLSGNISISGTSSIYSTTVFDSITVLTGSGSKTFNDLIVNGSFKPDGTHIITGNFFVSNSGILLEGTSTTTFAGAQSQFSVAGNSPATFNNIVIAAGSTMTARSELRCNGTFRATGNFTAQNNFTVTGTCTVSRTGSLMTMDGTTAEFDGNLAVSGSLTIKGICRFGNVTKITGAGLKLFNVIEITGSVTASSGNMTVTGDILNNGTFLHNNGSITFSGDQVKKIKSEIQNGNPMVFNTMFLNGGAAAIDLQFETDVSLIGVLTLVTATGSAVLDADGSTDRNVFTLLSTNDNPATDASIAALSGDAVITGNVHVQRYMNGEGQIYRYIASPMAGTGATVASWMDAFPITGTFSNPSDPGVICGHLVKSNNPSLFFFDEIHKKWQPYPVVSAAADNPLTPGLGYAAYIRDCTNPTRISVYGNLTDGTNRGRINLPVHHTDTVSTYNNLVGNPYPSAFRWDLVELSNVSPTIAIRDNGSGMFRYYTQSGAGADGIPHGVISQGQAFWVRSAGSAPSAVISEQAKVPSSASSGNIFFRDTEYDRLRIELVQSDTTAIDETFIVLNDSSSADERLDVSDAPKLNNVLDDTSKELPDLFTSNRSEGISYALNAIPIIKDSTSIYLSVRDLSTGGYQFKIIRYGQFSRINILMTDRFSHTTSAFSESSAIHFTITDDQASRSLTRFKMNFILPPPEITGLATTKADESVWPNPAENIIEVNPPGPGEGYKIVLTDLSGTPMIVSEPGGNGNSARRIDISTLSPGVYVISVTDGLRTSRRKLIKR